MVGKKVSAKVSDKEAKAKPVESESATEKTDNEADKEIPGSAEEVLTSFIEDLKANSPLVHSNGADIIVPGIGSDQHIPVPKPGKYRLILLEAD